MPQSAATQQNASGPPSATGPALSVIIPAYNESERLPPYLESIRPYIGRRYENAHEVIVVDDGSTDDLGTQLEQRFPDWPGLRTIRHGLNLGKGAAVRTGVLIARGERILYADADGATPIEEEEKLARAMDQGADLAVGSRLLGDPLVTVSRSWRRALVGRSFARAARRLVPVSVRDTQCGFKMLRRDVARRLFELSEEKGYLFDLEILALAQLYRYQVAEVPINWSDQPGSRMKMCHESTKIVRGLWRIRRRIQRLEADRAE